MESFKTISVWPKSVTTLRSLKQLHKDIRTTSTNHLKNDDISDRIFFLALTISLDMHVFKWCVCFYITSRPCNMYPPQCIHMDNRLICRIVKLMLKLQLRLKIDDKICKSGFNFIHFSFPFLKLLVASCNFSFSFILWLIVYNKFVSTVLPDSQIQRFSYSSRSILGHKQILEFLKTLHSIAWF